MVIGKRICILVLAIASAWQGVATAAVIVEPSDLNPGDQYRLAFVTSGTRNALSSDINDYNNFVTVAANAVPELSALGATWKAIASTDDIAAKDNTQATTGDEPVYLLNDTMLVAQTPDLWSGGGILNTLSITELGTEITAKPWTGSDSIGGINVLFPIDGSGSTEVGHTNLTNDLWLWRETLSADTLHPLYALSSTLTAPAAVPEPTTLAALSGLLGMGLIGCWCLSAGFKWNSWSRFCVRPFRHDSS